MTTTMTKPAFISPVDREIMEAIIKATCVYYEITEEQLIAISKKSEATAVRRQCFYLIRQNTNISNENISQRLQLSRSPVSRGHGIIEIHKKIYAHTSHALKGIAALANNFEKSCAWHIQ